MLPTTEVVKTVKETGLGKTRPLLGEMAVLGTSGLLERDVCKGITGMVFVKWMLERPPVPNDPTAEAVKMDSTLDDGCDEGEMVKDGNRELADSPGELGGELGENAG